VIGSAIPRIGSSNALGYDTSVWCRLSRLDHLINGFRTYVVWAGPGRFPGGRPGSAVMQKLSSGARIRARRCILTPNAHL
jgi:hypothetical protein